jgi:predicted enzyme related to lactoylglutathione lyase
MAVRIQCLCIDTTDPTALSRFWAEVLGWRITADDPDEVVLDP